MESRRKGSSGAKRWAFIGLMEFLRTYREQQVDAAAKLRWALMFEFRVLREIELVSVADESTLMAALLAQSREGGLVSADDRQVINSQDENAAYEERLAVEATRARLLSYEPQKFEILLRSLLIQSGFEKVQVTQYSQDGGIDVNAFPGPRSWPIREMLVQLQAKRWLHTVGRKEVAELRGSLKPHARGCLVTTSHFSRAALAESQDGGKIPIVLIDGYEMARIVSQLKLTVPDIHV